MDNISAKCLSWDEVVYFNQYVTLPLLSKQI